MSFNNLGLVPEILQAIAEQGYTVPTPIQLQAIPMILERRDVMAGAQTGFSNFFYRNKGIGK